MSIRRTIFNRLYESAASPTALPWHREHPPSLLETAVAARPTPGRALDLGCGEGVSTAYLAKNGWSVVGIDFVLAALELAQARIRESRPEDAAKVELLNCDVLDYQPTQRFDLILDSGCLHHIAAARHRDYQTKIDSWLLPGGDYVLVHFTKRHALDWWPFRPKSLSRQRIIDLFPSLRLEAYEETTFELPLLMGSTSLAGVYWFRRDQPE